jgi:hypothetical protein
MQLCVDPEIARARLQDLIEDCGDADILWLSDVIQQAFNEAAQAARSGTVTPGLPSYAKAARRRLSFKD